MSKRDSELTLEEQVERVRKKRMRYSSHTRLRMALNTAFLILAAIGLILYFAYSDRHGMALAIIALGMLLKLVEFFVRFLL